MTQIKFFMTTARLDALEHDINEWLDEAARKQWVIEDVSFFESPETDGYIPSTTVMVRYRFADG